MEINIVGLAKSFLDAGEEYIVLKGITCTIYRRSMVCVVGNSGSGKTTLLNTIAGILEPNMGSIMYDSKSIQIEEKREFRRQSVGYLAQYPEHNLFLNISVRDNFIFLLDSFNVPKKDWKSTIEESLKRVGLDHIPQKTKCRVLSGGELQRLALALVLLNNPDLIIADEPTGNLDSDNARIVLETLSEIAKEKAVVIASHDTLVQDYADVTYRLTDGRISAVYNAGVEIPIEEHTHRIPLLISKGGTITLPDSFMENLPDVRLIHAEIEGDKVILYFGGDKE